MCAECRSYDDLTLLCYLVGGVLVYIVKESANQVMDYAEQKSTEFVEDTVITARSCFFGRM